MFSDTKSLETFVSREVSSVPAVSSPRVGGLRASSAMVSLPSRGAGACCDGRNSAERSSSLLLRGWGLPCCLAVPTDEVVEQSSWSLGTVTLFRPIELPSGLLTPLPLPGAPRASGISSSFGVLTLRRIGARLEACLLLSCLLLLPVFSLTEPCLPVPWPCLPASSCLCSSLLDGTPDLRETCRLPASLSRSEPPRNLRIWRGLERLRWVRFASTNLHQVCVREAVMQ